MSDLEIRGEAGMHSQNAAHIIAKSKRANIFIKELTKVYPEACGCLSQIWNVF